MRNGDAADSGAYAARDTDGCRADCSRPVHCVSFPADTKAAPGSTAAFMKIIRESAEFLKRVRRKLRFGAISREPLLLLRFEWKGDSIECDWLMRQADSWDRELPVHLARENQTLQALRDALGLREVIFGSFPAVVTAELRMFRADAAHRLELVMTGSVSRSNETFERVASIAMRARLCGFHFTLVEGGLGPV